MGERGKFPEQCDIHTLDRATSAARNDAIMGPLESGLDRAHTVIRGLAEIFQIAKDNAIEDCHIETIEPQLSAYTTDALLGLGAAVSRMLANDIEKLVHLADTQYAPANGLSSKGRG